jgi:hypothetical protein
MKRKIKKLQRAGDWGCGAMRLVFLGTPRSRSPRWSAWWKPGTRCGGV